MKKLMSLVLLMMCWTNIFSQSEPIEFDREGGFSRVVEVKANAKQAFQYSRAFLSKRISNYQKAVQFEDAEANKLQVLDKYLFLEPGRVSGQDTTFYRGYEFGKITIDCKDDKIRIKLESPTYDYDTYIGRVKINNSIKDEKFTLMNALVLNREHFAKKRSNHYLALIQDLVKYIKKQVEDEDF